MLDTTSPEDGLGEHTGCIAPNPLHSSMPMASLKPLLLHMGTSYIHISAAYTHSSNGISTAHTCLTL